MLKHVHDTIDEIPEGFRELYTQKNGRFELTGITGIQTQANVDRLETALRKERDEHKATKDRFAWAAELKPDEVLPKLDKFPELEAAAAGKIDDQKIEEIAARRAEGTIKSRLSPLERQLKEALREREELAKVNSTLIGRENRRHVLDAMDRALEEAKTLPTARADAHLLADVALEYDPESKTVLTREGALAGIAGGLDPAALLAEMREQRPHWWPASMGGGSRGGGVVGGIVRNPWSREHWSLTEQGAYLRQHGKEKAEKAAAAAGVALGATRPAPKA